MTQDSKLPPVEEVSGNSLPHDYVRCELPNCKEWPEDHCGLIWCGAPRNHPNHTIVEVVSMPPEKLKFGTRVRLVGQGTEVYTIESSEKHQQNDLVFYRLKELKGSLFLRSSLETAPSPEPSPVPPTPSPEGQTFEDWWSKSSYCSNYSHTLTARAAWNAGRRSR